jgi:predicted transcriptional regulator
MRATITLPDPLFESVDRLAARLGLTRSQLIERAVLRLLGNSDSQGVTDALNEVYRRAGQDQDELRMLTSLQLASLAKDTW